MQLESKERRELLKAKPEEEDRVLTVKIESGN